METYLECAKRLNELLAGARAVRITVPSTCHSRSRKSVSARAGTGWSRFVSMVNSMAI